MRTDTRRCEVTRNARGEARGAAGRHETLRGATGPLRRAGTTTPTTAATSPRSHSRHPAATAVTPQPQLSPCSPARPARPRPGRPGRRDRGGPAAVPRRTPCPAPSTPGCRTRSPPRHPAGPVPPAARPPQHLVDPRAVERADDACSEMMQVRRDLRPGTTGQQHDQAASLELDLVSSETPLQEVRFRHHTRPRGRQIRAAPPAAQIGQRRNPIEVGSHAAHGATGRVQPEPSGTRCTTR